MTVYYKSVEVELPLEHCPCEKFEMQVNQVVYYSPKTGEGNLESYSCKNKDICKACMDRFFQYCEKTGEKNGTETD